MSGDTGTNPPGDAWAEATDDVASARAEEPEAEESAESTVEDAPAEEAVAEEAVAEEVKAEEPKTTFEKASDARQTEDAATDEKSDSVQDSIWGEDKVAPATAKDVLAAVAAGAITPDEAAEWLDKLKSKEEETSKQAEVPATAAKPKRVRIRAVGRRVKIVGEPFVKTIAVDGPHVVRQEGDTLLISSEGEFGASLDGFTLTPPRSLRDVQQKLMDLGRELSIRVNPGLEIEAEITAGSINAERAPLLAQVRVTAGSARVRDVEGPIDVLVQAGSAQVEGKIVNGRSRLRVESGSLQLRLLQGSSVRIRPDAQLGRVQWEPPARPGKEGDEQVVGGGAARLDLEVVMGAATVKEAP
jgi:hypothetical protein